MSQQDGIIECEWTYQCRREAKTTVYADSGISKNVCGIHRRQALGLIFWHDKPIEPSGQSEAT